MCTVPAFVRTNTPRTKMRAGQCNGRSIHWKKRLGVSSPWAAQRALVCTQACYPATVNAGRFSLLCFQPEAMLVSVAARTCQLPSAHPCRAPTWQGHAINMLRRPCAVRRQSTNLAPAWVTGERNIPRLSSNHFGDFHIRMTLPTVCSSGNYKCWIFVRCECWRYQTDSPQNRVQRGSCALMATYLAGAGPRSRRWLSIG